MTYISEDMKVHRFFKIVDESAVSNIREWCSQQYNQSTFNEARSGDSVSYSVVVQDIKGLTDKISEFSQEFGSAVTAEEFPGTQSQLHPSQK